MPDKEINKSPFVDRHIGPRAEDIELMLITLGYSTMARLHRRCCASRYSFIISVHFRVVMRRVYQRGLQAHIAEVGIGST